MKRKEFVRNLLAAAPLAYLPSVLLSGCKKEEPDNGKTVLIVGAGMAGLAAGAKLKQNGFTVIMLEGRDRPGGRIRTNRSGGIVFDEGASWIHGPTGNPIKKLASGAGADTYLTDDDSVSIYDSGGTLISDSVIDDAESDYEDALTAVVNSGSQSQDFASVFDGLYPGRSSNDFWKYLLSSYIEFDSGGDISRLSSLYHSDDEAFGGKDRIITNGYDKVTDYLAEDLDIRLNEVVSLIEYSGEMAKVTTDKGEHEADYVLVTVPLGVLQAGDITFSPALPTNKLTALGELEMGNINKFLLSWSAPFWDTSIQYIGYTPSEKGKFNYFLNLRTFSNSNSLMTFSYGNYGLQTESMSDQDVESEIMSHLRAIYGSNIPNPTSMLRTKWKADPFAKGAYSFVAAGGTSAAYDTLAVELEGKLFFAGEHTSREYRSTVHGAFLSGEREAEKIIDLV